MFCKGGSNRGNYVYPVQYGGIGICNFIQLYFAEIGDKLVDS